MTTHTHIVASGDTLWDLAQQYYGESRLHPVLRAANRIDDPATMAVGLVLTIPDLGSARTHDTVEGDTLADLADRYYGDAGKWSVIADANGITDPATLPIGQLLWIPDSAVPGTMPAPSPPQPLHGSTREVLKATLVPIEIHDPGGEDTPERGSSGALVKAAAIRQLQLTPGETEALRRSGAAESARYGAVADTTFDTIATFEQTLVPALQPEISAVAPVPMAELLAFTDLLVERRREALDSLRQAREQAPTEEIGREVVLLNAAIVAARGLRERAIAHPIGMLNLERIEMVPVGIERGELVSTIPLAPGEETAVTHKEWSVTSKEFTTIVTDTLDEVSETGVTDNTDIAQSTSSQTQHSNQFNITGTVQGGIPIVSGSTTTGFTAQDGGSTSAAESRKHARSLTQKASSRSRQEHKVTIATRTETGTSETSTRVLKNSARHPIRIDYFSMMRQWRVRLYRYGLRLTYDVVVPEPAAAMRKLYAELDTWRSQLKPFDFPAVFADLDPNVKVDAHGNPDPAGQPKYQWLADKYDAAIPAYPAAPEPVTKGKVGGTNSSWAYMEIEFDVPAGAEIAEILVTANIGKHEDGGPIVFAVMGSTLGRTHNGDFLAVHDEKAMGFDGKPFMAGHTGHRVVTVFFHRVAAPFIQLKVLSRTRAQGIDQWKNDVWSALLSAAQNRHFVEQQEIAGKIAALEERLADVDTLTLRREESDEIMKSVIRWILGPAFEFMPNPVLDAFGAAGVDLIHGSGFDSSQLGMTTDQWALVRQHENIVRFINQAIEWENVVTFLYSYFWDVPPSWNFIRSLRHPDPTRQAFLRAGAARVVLTVRKGWEDKWVRFAETGSIDGSAAAPYLSVAREIAAYDDRNYPGIAPANPAKTATRLQESVYATCAQQVAPSAQPVTLDVDSSKGFVVGLPVVLDIYDDAQAQEAVRIVAVPNDHQITVEKVGYPHDGSQTPFPVIQPGERGTLIAEWNEYTPTSGTDIAVTSNLASIA
ncbi:LysM peptidoglycan-binding domain-containing protein [Nocardia cyriacigeorgica]|uniref:LysM peptidoglycan-binding domain-containing protein n=2 Tax=Nocardia cyriacigeorgica TaxID=135487 RepID=UPI0024577182|nr:LysM peptidoglycan-binding domain-containing protein [Nocardia cyriacigeorgica]